MSALSTKDKTKPFILIGAIILGPIVELPMLLFITRLMLDLKEWFWKHLAQTTTPFVSRAT